MPLIKQPIINGEIDAIEVKLDDPATGLVALKAEIDDNEVKIDAIEVKLDDPATGLVALKAEIDDNEAKIDLVEGKLDARLDATISSRAPEVGGSVADILTDTADIQPRILRILCKEDFWGDIIEELQLGAANQANLALGGNVVIAGLPDDITLVRVVVMFMCRAIENTHAQNANMLNGAQNIEVGFAGANFIDAIALATDLFAVALSTREMGTVMVGGIDVKATVTGNGTCTFRIDAARADVDNLNFNDYQVGVRVYFTV